MSLADFPGLVSAFFTDRLMRQRQASSHTIVSYRDTFRLLIRYAQPGTGQTALGTGA